MNQKKIKKLRRLAKQILVANKTDPDEGKNKYYTENNRHGIEYQLDEKGFPLMDVDGKKLFKHTYQPGTLHVAHKSKIVTNALKKVVRERGKDGRRNPEDIETWKGRDQGN